MSNSARAWPSSRSAAGDRADAGLVHRRRTNRATRTIALIVIVIVLTTLVVTLAVLGFGSEANVAILIAIVAGVGNMVQMARADGKT